MTAQKRWGVPAIIVVLAAVGCSGQIPSVEPSASGPAANQPAPVSSVAQPTDQSPAAQAPHEISSPTPLAPQAGAQPGWPTEHACEAGAQHLKSMYSYAPPLSHSNVMPDPNTGNLYCAYGSSGGLSAEAIFDELYVDPAKNLNVFKVCDEASASQHWLPIPYPPATNIGWAAYAIPELRDDEVKSAICGSTFMLTVTLIKFPGATDQNALDLAMAMVNH